MRPRTALALAAVIALFVAGAAQAASGSRAAFDTVKVTFTDSTLHAAPNTPASGKTTFLVVNHGRKTHTLYVEGPGVRRAHSAAVRPGRTAKLVVTLRPGAYSLSDPKGLGEFKVLFLQVTSSATLSGGGSRNTVQPTVTLPAMCGEGYTP